MAHPKIHKISGYVVDPYGRFTKGCLPYCMVDCECMLRHYHFESVNISEEQLYAVKDKNCDLAVCERNFSKTPSQGDAERKLVLGGTYRHFKVGKLVKVICVSQDTEFPGAFSVIYEGPDGRIWNRPYDMFMSKVDKGKYPNATQEYRFEFVEE